MWRNKLSLKRPSDTSMNSSNSMDLSDSYNSYVMETSSTETQQATNAILDLLEPSRDPGDDIYITQSDKNQDNTPKNAEKTNSSFELNLDGTGTQTSNDWGLESKLKEINELMEQRHYIATLLYSMRNYSTKTAQPKFLHTLVDFHPYYGSPQAKEFFVNKLASIRTDAQNFVKEKIMGTCKDFINLKTKEAELTRTTSRNLVNGIEPAKELLEDFELRANKTAREWNEKYKTATSDIDSKAKAQSPRDESVNRRQKPNFGTKRVRRA